MIFAILIAVLIFMALMAFMIWAIANSADHNEEKDNE